MIGTSENSDLELLPVYRITLKTVISEPFNQTEWYDFIKVCHGLVQNLFNNVLLSLFSPIYFPYNVNEFFLGYSRMIFLNFLKEVSHALLQESFVYTHELGDKCLQMVNSLASLMNAVFVVRCHVSDFCL